ncbi:hypothetical protein HZU77_006005 [Neisseriaceae bacterium TC5R-5]|nr:hypothetical protein [Neisseriaceae bacterium TC5R-5]
MLDTLFEPSALRNDEPRQTESCYSVANLILACSDLHHSAQCFDEETLAEQALIRSGFCPRHHVYVGADGSPAIDDCVREQVALLLASNQALHFTLQEMLLQFGANVCDASLANIIVRGLRSIQDWQTACFSLARLRVGPRR